MRIGLDFDGTIADTTTAKIRYAREAFGLEISALETWGAAGPERLGVDRFREMVEAVHQTRLSLDIPPLAGALEALQLLVARHDLYLVTARDDVEVQWVGAWLDAHGARMLDVVHTSRAPKIEACRDLRVDVMLDDTPRVLHELAEAGLGAALIEAPYNLGGSTHEAVHLVPHWPAFVDLCRRLEARAPRTATAPPGPLDLAPAPPPRG